LSIIKYGENTNKKLLLDLNFKQKHFIISQKLNKDIQLNITGQEVELDKTILESLR